MPYRRLPNTDNARIKSLKQAHELGSELPPFKLAYSQTMYNKIKSILPTFENTIQDHRNAMNLHAERNREYQEKMKKARLYISHFIQVVDMAILRGERPSEIRHIYGLIIDERKLPGLSSEEEILVTGRNLIEGEKSRKLKGQSPITNPTIALVQVHFEKFLDAYQYQKSIKKRAKTAHESLENLREKVDDIIQQTWNEIEDTYKDLPEDMRREKCSIYGITYVYRKSELSDLSLLPIAQMG